MNFEGQKPEKLLQRIIESSSNQGDIVLDYHAGTGTTLAVAHKTGRQYIGIEQMDYIHDLPESRLKKVIAGEQGGISKDVNWQGGGDFVYMELMEWNEKIVKEVREAKTEKELDKIWNDFKDNTFLSWRIDTKIFDEKAKDFADLNIFNKKKFLIECLDKNQLYVNLSEIEDKEYEINGGDIKLNREFYE
jgi:adenine-specific DNA-methyltransferase